MPEIYRKTLDGAGLVGSIGGLGSLYDNANVESFMKTLKVEAVYPTAYETFEEAAEDLLHFIEKISNSRRLHSALGYHNPEAV